MSHKDLAGTVTRFATIPRIACMTAALAFVWFAYYRVEFIGGCDSASYLAESFRLRGVDVGLRPDPSLPTSEAFVPICMVGHSADGARSLFPPGFPVLLAGAGMVGLQLFVMPFFGALGGLALFHLARARSGDGIALGAMIAWYTAPLTFWGSTQIMSDVVAASILLLAAVAVERGKALVAGLVFGFVLGVRPMCALAIPAFALLLAPRPRREAFHAAAALVLAGFGWLLFVRLSCGSFDLPYAGNANELTGENFVTQVEFTSKEVLRQYAPIVVLAVIGLLRAHRKAFVYVVWFAPFLVVHLLWRAPYVWWWQLRFLASALPALFLAAALGARALADLLRQRSTRVQRVVAGIAYTALIVYATRWVLSPETEALRTRERDERYGLDTKRVLDLVPRDAVIGAREHTISLRFYGRLQTFRWCHPDVPALERATLAQGRSVYAVFMFDDENGCPEQSAANRAGLHVEQIAVLPSNSRLVRLSIGHE